MKAKKTELRRDYLGLDSLKEHLEQAQDESKRIGIAAGEVFDMGDFNDRLGDLISVVEASMEQMDDMYDQGFMG